jgi:VanZ family protein
MGLIFFLSSRPDLPQAPGALWDLLIKKAAHFAVFGILAGLYILGMGHGEVATRRMFWLALLWTALFAASDEIHQAFVPGRHARVMDWSIDMAGAAVTLLTLWRVRGFLPGGRATRS